MGVNKWMNSVDTVMVQEIKFIQGIHTLKVYRNLWCMELELFKLDNFIYYYIVFSGTNFLKFDHQLQKLLKGNPLLVRYNKLGKQVST